MKNNTKLTVFCLFYLFLCFSVLMGALPSIPQYAGSPNPLSTPQTKAKTVATVTADASSPSTDEMSWTHCISSFIPIDTSWNEPCLSFYGYGDGDGAGDPNGATFSYDVYVCDLYGGMKPVVLGNTGAIGEQTLSHDPVEGTELNSGSISSSYKWADTMAEGTCHWGYSPTYSNYEGDNGIAEIIFDRNKSYGIWVRIYDMTDQPVTSITCVMNGY